MAARQQPPVRRAESKSKATDSKDGKETDVELDMRTTEDDWDRLGELIKPGLTVFIITISYRIFDQFVDGKENNHMNNGKLKKASKKVEKVIYVVGKKEDFSVRNFVRDSELIKCLSLMYEVHNPYLWIPALDGFEIALQRNCVFYKGRPVKTKSQGTKERKARAYKTLTIEEDLGSRATFEDIKKRIAAKRMLLKPREESDSRKRAKSADKFDSKDKSKTREKSGVKLESKAAEVPDSSKNANESDSGKKANATEYSDAKIESKATKRSEPRKKPKTAKESDSRKRTKAREKCSAKQVLKAIERESRSAKEEMTYDSESGKGTDNQEEEASSRPVNKSIRTCMTCSLQEPAPKVFKKCRRCKDEGCPDPPYYCGRDCQVLDWTARHRQQHEKNYAGDPATS